MRRDGTHQWWLEISQIYQAKRGELGDAPATRGASNPRLTKSVQVCFCLVKPYYPTKDSYDSGTKSANEGENVVIKCRPEGIPKPISIIWEKNNVRVKITDTDDPDLVFNNVTREYRGRYVCKASNKAGSADTNPSTRLEVKCMYFEIFFI